MAISVSVLFIPARYTKKCRPRKVCIQFLMSVDRLPAVLVGDGELLAAVTTAGGEHAAAVGGGHAGAEAVLVHALAVGGLKCSFHRIYLLYFC